jgi:hypothetical protein
MTLGGRLVETFLPDQRSPGCVGCMYGIARPPVDMGGTEGIVKVFEREALKAPMAAAAPSSRAGAEDSATVSVNKVATPKIESEIPKLNDYFTFERKLEPDGSDNAEGAVVWTHHYQGVDIPEQELPDDTLARLKEWLRKFVAEREAIQAKEREEEEKRRLEARIARLKREQERDALKKQEQEEKRRIEKEKEKIEEEKRARKQELEKAADIAEAAKRQEEEQHRAIIEDVKQLKREQVRRLFCNFCVTSVLE